MTLQEALLYFYAIGAVAVLVSLANAKARHGDRVRTRIDWAIIVVALWPLIFIGAFGTGRVFRRRQK